MHLLIAMTAAFAATVIWYANEKARRMSIGTLCLMFWGASLMWLVDAVVEYTELQAEYFNPEFSDMINDTFLGLSVVIFGIVIWLVILLIKDPYNVIRKTLTAEKK